MDLISKTKLDIFASLDTPKMRRRRALFPVEGIKSVSDLLPVFELDTLLIDATVWDSDRNSELDVLTGIVPSKKIRLIRPADMRRVSSLTTPSPVIAIFKLPESGYEDSIPTKLPSELYLLLDGVRDPGNFGTIIRTADWFGIHTVFASKESADIFNWKCIQATMGSLAHVRVIYTNLAQLITTNRELPVFGTLLEGNNIYEEQLPNHGFIVMGNEGKGITDEIRELITNPLNIPPYSPVHGESLNVAAATAVVLSEFRKSK